MAKFKGNIRKKTEKQLIRKFISIFNACAIKKKKLNQRMSFVLTGGPSPVNLYKSLSNSKIDWSNIDFFWGDERCVDHKSKNSNYNLVKKHLLNKIKINIKNIYSINTKNKNVNWSALNYEKVIKKYFDNRKKSFDIILLGMGPDGHIASIFEDQMYLKTNRVISPVIRKDFKRITINLKIINKAKNIFLWLNSKKQTKIFKLLERDKKKIPVYFLKKRKTIIYTIALNNI